MALHCKIVIIYGKIRDAVPRFYRDTAKVKVNRRAEVKLVGRRFLPASKIKYDFSLLSFRPLLLEM